jgi:hypothetical protein
MRRFESSRPSQLISLRLLLFHVPKFQRSWEASWGVFVPLLISPRLVPIQFCNCVASDLCVPRQIMRRLVAGDRINLDLSASGPRQRHHSSAAQVVKGQPGDSGTVTLKRTLLSLCGVRAKPELVPNISKI